MAGLFDASTVAMRSTAGKVVADSEAIRADLSALGNRLAALQGQWVGDGRMAFVTAHGRYEAANARLNQALAEIARLIGVNEARYTADDASASSALQGAGAGFEVPGF